MCQMTYYKPDNKIELNLRIQIFFSHIIQINLQNDLIAMNLIPGS